MAAKIISLTDYRDGIHAEGRTLFWRGRRLALTARQALALAECLQEARVLRGQWAAAGIIVVSNGRTVTLKGTDFGPGKVHGAKAAALTLELARAGRLGVLREVKRG